MRRFATALAALSVTLAAAPVRAEQIVLKPSSQWNVDFAKDSCRLLRLFGEGENQHYLAFQQYAPGDSFGLTAAGPAFKRFQSLARTKLRFSAEQEPYTTTPFTGSVEAFGTGVIYSSLNLDIGEPPTNRPDSPDEPGLEMLDLERGKQVQFIELRQGSRDVRLETGPLDAAFEVLNQCTLDLVRDWGLEAKRHVDAQSGPRWINKDAVARRIMATYPRAALLDGEQGIMRMRVIVSAQGAVESCTILKATKTEELESPACRHMATAQFEPARDAAGVPFRSYYATSITYRMQ